MSECTPLLARVAAVPGATPRAVILNASGQLVFQQVVGGPFLPSRIVAHHSAVYGERHERVLIEGHVRSLLLPLLATETLPLWTDDSPAHSLPFKLRVKRETQPGWVYVDADSRVTLPGGEMISIELVAPDYWIDLPAPQNATGVIAGPLFGVEGRVRACVVCCPTPPVGRLTYVFDSPDGGGLVMAVPRRGETLHLYSVGGSIPALDMTDVLSGARSRIQGNSGFSISPQTAGAWPYVASSGTYTDGTIVWEIR